MIHKKFRHYALNVDAASIEPGLMEDTMRECKSENIQHLVIVNWPAGISLDFLKGQDFIKGIAVLSCVKVDISPINWLHNLEYFEIDTNKNIGIIDFENFPSLKHLKFAYSDSAFKNFKALKNLTHLTVNNWPFKNLENLVHHTMLEELEFNFAKKLETLKGIEKIPKLSRLKFYSAPVLTNVSDLEGNRDTLKKLSFELAKRVEGFTVLDKLNNLESFYIFNSAPIHSIAFMKKLNLRYAYIGVEVLDGDIGFLAEKKFEYKKLRRYRQ